MKGLSAVKLHNLKPITGYWKSPNIYFPSTELKIWSLSPFITSSFFVSKGVMSEESNLVTFLFFHNK
jgi:hypothetical protein